MTFTASTYWYITDILNMNPWLSVMPNDNHTLNLWLSKTVIGATAFTDTGKTLLCGEWKDVLKSTIRFSAAGSAN